MHDDVLCSSRLQMSEAVVNLTAGTVAGMTGVLADYPLDTVKTRMQVSSYVQAPRFQNSATSTAVTSSRGGAPRVYWQCASQLYRCGGVRSFYRGLSLPLAAQGAEAAVVFSVYSQSLQYFLRKQQLQHQEREDGKKRMRLLVEMSQPHESPQEDDSHGQRQLLRSQTSVWRSPAHWKASACAGFAVSFVLTPVEVLKCNRQMQNASPHWRHRQTTSHRAALFHVATRSVCGLYTGMTGTVLRAVLGNMAYFVSYEQSREWLAHELTEPLRAGEALPVWHSMLAGGISGCCYWTVAYPADVAKTNMQVCPSARQQGFTKTLARLYRTGGVASLFRGWGITMIRAFLSSSIVFTTHEQCSSCLRKCPCVVTRMRDSAAASTPNIFFEPQAELFTYWQ